MVNYKEKIQQNYLSHRFIEKLVDALLVRNFPYVHRNRLRMSNSFEHITKEICRHTLFAQVMESPKIFFSSNGFKRLRGESFRRLAVVALHEK